MQRGNLLRQAIDMQSQAISIKAPEDQLQEERLLLQHQWQRQKEAERAFDAAKTGYKAPSAQN